MPQQVVKRYRLPGELLEPSDDLIEHSQVYPALIAACQGVDGVRG